MLIDLKGCTLTVNGAEVKFSDGNFQWTEANAVKVVLNNGKLDGAKFKYEDEQPIEWSFQGRWDSADTAAYSALQSQCLFNMSLSFVPNTCWCDCGCASFTFPDCTAESIQFDVQNNSCSVSGKCIRKYL